MVLMLIIPVALYFLCHDWLLPGMVPDDSTRTTVSGLLAVIAVKVVSTIYAVTAWREERADREAEQVLS